MRKDASTKSLRSEFFNTALNGLIIAIIINTP